MNSQTAFSGNQRPRLRGVQHLPQADIQNIRDLLHGYGSPGSIMKELIQNAEDAAAQHLDLIVSHGDSTAAHPLLRTPALCAVNDGTFEPKHRDAIFRLGLGTKGADPRAIGRFGKGLKSVFALCEAFFVVSETDSQSGWSPGERVCEFFNPWNGWRHEDWDNGFDSAPDRVFAIVAQQVAAFAAECPHWLAFWFPLRHSSQRHDSQGNVAWIHESSEDILPGEDADWGNTLAEEFRILAPSLVTLRSLRRIRVIDVRTPSHCTTEWSVDSSSRRSSEPGRIREPEQLAGALVLTNSGGPAFSLRYTGYAGTLPESAVSNVRSRPGWPTVVDISEAGSSADGQAKGEPHYATILTAQPATTGSFEVRWAVFFPVSEQPDGTSSVGLSRLKQALTLNLHGFFFLDTERRRVDGLQQHFGDRSHACLEWNKIIATEGAISHVPETLALFARGESLDFEESAELAEAFRRTWVWSKFAEATCGRQTWRPRWRCGAEKWELIPADETVLPIPRVPEASDILACLPRLGELSEQVALVAQGSDGTLPGLHHREAGDWPENLVLQVLDGVQLSSNSENQAAADWLNRFLSYLHADNSLTPAIRERISTLPLLPVRAAGTDEHRRLSAVEWDRAIASDHLFAQSAPRDGWLHLLRQALPDWSCLLAEWTMPAWFLGKRPPTIDALRAASAVLSQSRLGDFAALGDLVRHLVAQPDMPDAVCSAVRYLMHGNPAQAGNGQQFLFLPSTQTSQLIWSRLIKHLLIHEGGGNSWRLLHQQWASVLSPKTQQDLAVSTIDAQGAWEELRTAQIDFSTLEFHVAEWSDADIATLLHGLFQASNSGRDETAALLRRLRLHTLRGQRGRVSIAGVDGRLGELFVLQTEDFDSTIPQELLPLWGRFLANTRIVERVQNDLAAAVQVAVFRSSAATGDTYEATLDWNYVVRRCLESDDACVWAPLIMEALSHGDQAVRGLGSKLKQTEWLPLSPKGHLAPASTIRIEGLEAELHELLDPAKDGLAGTRALAQWVVEHRGFATLKKYFPDIEESVGLLGLWLKDKPNWHLGLERAALPAETDKFLGAIEDLSELPGAALLAKLWRLPSQAKNAEWDGLLQETVWESLLQRFPPSTTGTSRLERVLVQLATTASRIAFDAYLRQAVTDSVIASLLPRLSLVNQRGQWRPAKELIWPSTNLDPAAQVCFEQAKILSPIHVEGRQRRGSSATPQRSQVPERGNQLEHEPDFEAQAGILADYLKPFRNGNVGDTLPAALVAILGGNPAMRALLRQLLQSGLGQQPDDFLALLLGEDRNRVIEATRSERFLIEVVRGDSTSAQTVTGDTVTVGLTQDIGSLLVGDPDDLWHRYFYRYQQDSACHLLRLREIKKPDDLPDPVGIFAATIETILLKAHCNGVADLCPKNLKEVLGGVADAGQADLRRSQLYLLDMAEARLKELAVRGHEKLDQVLRRFSDARQARVDAELLRKQAPGRAREKLERANKLVDEAKRGLVGLLESPEEEATRRMLVSAVRRKMTDFQYAASSVALELFQNADDAVAEWEEMKEELHPHEKHFFLHLDTMEKRLELLHWGRPINQHTFAGFQHGVKRGYDQDLQKMLTLNFSDKGVSSPNEPVTVTGRFGLGFKTVFFVADEPEVISGRLAFQIRGGFYPVSLASDRAEALREWTEILSEPGLVPTAIRLPWAAGIRSQDLAEALADFARIAPLLSVFARRIRTLVVKNGDDSLTISCQEQALTGSGRLTHIQVAQDAYLCFRCRLRGDERPASVLLPLDASGVAHLPENMPRLWITTPTSEHSDYRWAVNAPLKPDAGRQRLALNNPINRQIAEELAHAWLQALVELFDETKTRWDAFGEKLGLHSSASFVTWWRRMWSEMARSRPVCRWENLRDGGQLLGYIAWGESIGGMLRLVQQRAAIPALLPGAYDQLVKSGDVHFSVTGLLADQANGCLAQILQWESVQAGFPPGQTVDGEISLFLQHILPGKKLEGELSFRAALKVEMGNQHEVNHMVAERLGRLFVQCQPILHGSSPYAAEVQPVLSWLRQARFLASDQQYHLASQLVCVRHVAGAIENDEPLRAAFAPPSAVLSSGYSDDALHFFVEARGQLAANAATLASWVAQASECQIPAVFRYLIEGELGQELADELKLPWLEKHRSTAAYRSLSELDQSELERKFSRGRVHLFAPFIKASSIEPAPVFQVMEADVAFRRVSEWWTREHKSWAARYEARTYPAGFPGGLPWPGDGEWDAVAHPNARMRWLLLFIHAALVPLGFNRIGRDQTFTRFLVENGWLDVFADVADGSHSLFTALDNYLDSYVQETRFHFQMRQFVAFYAVSRNLDAFLHSLRAAEHTDMPNAFTRVFSPKANSALAGTGIVAPPLSGMLGMGTCQLLRELYRLGRLTNPHGYQFAFTPLRKVRRLATQLFGTSEGHPGAAASVSIFSELQELGSELGLDPTFRRCFDLPLQILAEDKELRTGVLQEEFEAEAMDNEELDAAPTEFTRWTL